MLQVVGSGQAPDVAVLLHTIQESLSLGARGDIDCVLFFRVGEDLSVKYRSVEYTVATLYLSGS